MTNKQDKINQLLNKLEILLKRQNDFSREINNLRVEINNLKITETKQTSEKEEIITDYPIQQQQTAKESLRSLNIERVERSYYDIED